MKAVVKVDVLVAETVGLLVAWTENWMVALLVGHWGGTKAGN